MPGEVRRISAKTRSWEQAEREARRLSGAAQVSEKSGQDVRSAISAYLEVKEQQSLSKSWTYKIKRETGKPGGMVRPEGHLVAVRVESPQFGGLPEDMDGAAVTRHKRQERLRSFFLYCVRHRWVTGNTAANLSGIKVSTPPTLPLTRDEFKRVLECTAEYNPRSSDREKRLRRARAMLLLRWSGLRLGDAARLVARYAAYSARNRSCSMFTSRPGVMAADSRAITLAARQLEKRWSACDRGISISEYRRKAAVDANGLDYMLHHAMVENK